MLKAYLKRWGKTILVSFILGLIFFSFAFLNRSFLLSKVPFSVEEERIGIAGALTIDDLPAEVLDRVSIGLTRVSSDGRVSPAASEKWEIKDDGRIYVFYLRDDIYFSDGEKLTSRLINYDFTDVTVERPAEKVIVFKLKDPYTPFIVTASRKIFKKNFIGLGEYRLTDVKTNGEFIQSVKLTSVKDRKKVIYQFYPTQEALKNAFVLGEVTNALDINDTVVYGTNLASFRNAKISKGVNENKLVTVFYNTQDKVLSDKKIRKALTYSLPDQFKYGRRNFLSFPEGSWGAELVSGIPKRDLEHAKTLLSDSSASDSGKLVLELKTLPQYENVAEDVKKVWAELGVSVKIEKIDTVPDVFQVFLGEFFVPKDPDQYALWHSDQSSNISKYKNLRIDKLLEDGRKTVDLNERKKIYADFQKYLLDDAPASFLFFPFVYKVERK